MDDEAVMPVETRLPYRVWRKTPCGVPGHHHCGPAASCLATMARLEELGDGAHLCHGCRAPVARHSVCARCGRDHAPVPEKPAVLFGGGERVGRYQSDSLGCVERVASVERAWLNGDLS